ncbi:MAG: hypothetical protein WD336_05570 [Trueperaceae bacterium]
MPMRQETPEGSRARPGATTALWIGVAFSLAVTGLIWILGPRLDAIALLPDAGATWYYWKLPEPTVWTRFLAWGLYLAHQLTLWGLIWWAQVHRPGYGTGLHRVNVLALAANGLFVLLHVAQTHLAYDGLAQDVSIWSSQGAVIVMLVWILLLENPRRGLVFGAKLPMGPELKRMVRQYHGYFFAWAIVYTFWFHPAVSTEGHLWGFFYAMLLLVQSSLFFTRAQLNRVWTFVLEVTVLIHGALVAVGQGGGIWPMFAFGFGGLIVMTQMHGLGLSRLARAGILAIYAGLVTYVYSGRGWDRIDEIFRIPVIEVLAALLLAGLFAGTLAIVRRWGPGDAPARVEVSGGGSGPAPSTREVPRRGVVPFLTVAYGAMVSVFLFRDEPVGAFVVLAVTGPIVSVLARWRVERFRAAKRSQGAANDR